MRSSELTVPDPGVNAAQRLLLAAPSVAGWRLRWLPRTPNVAGWRLRWRPRRRIGVESLRPAVPPRLHLSLKRAVLHLSQLRPVPAWQLGRPRHSKHCSRLQMQQSSQLLLLLLRDSILCSFLNSRSGAEGWLSSTNP